MTMKSGKGKKPGDNHKASSGNDKKTSTSSKKKQEELNGYHTIESSVPGERNMAHSMG